MSSGVDIKLPSLTKQVVTQVSSVEEVQQAIAAASVPSFTISGPTQFTYYSGAKIPENKSVTLQAICGDSSYTAKTYQWQYPDTDGNLHDIAGATSATITIPYDAPYFTGTTVTVYVKINNKYIYTATLSKIIAQDTWELQIDGLSGISYATFGACPEPSANQAFTAKLLINGVASSEGITFTWAVSGCLSVIDGDETPTVNTAIAGVESSLGAALVCVATNGTRTISAKKVLTISHYIADVKTWQQNTAPTIGNRPNALNGDIWYNLSTSKKYRAISNAWVEQEIDIPAISGLVANANGSITLNFSSAETLFSKFNIYRSIDNSKYAVVGSLAHNDDSSSYSFTDTGTSQGQIYYYKISGVYVGGNETALSSPASITSVVTTTPNPPTSITAIADNANTVRLSAVAPDSTDPLYKAAAYRWFISRDSGATWFQLPDTANASTLFYYDRSIDKFPEISDLSNYRFRVYTVSVYGVISSGYFTGSVDTTNYGTWIPAAPVVAQRTSGRGVSVSWDSISNLYGITQYRIQISKDNSTWYTPVTGTTARIDEAGWYTGSAGLYLSLFSLQWDQTLPLAGQSSGIPTDTTYYFRVARYNATTGVVSAYSPVTCVATATTAADVAAAAIDTAQLANDAVTLDKLYVLAKNKVNSFTGGTSAGWSLGARCSLVSDSSVSNYTMLKLLADVQTPSMLAYSAKFTVLPDELYSFSFGIYGSTAIAASGAGMYFGLGPELSTQYYTVYKYNYTTKKWEVANASANNPYFITDYRAQGVKFYKTFILGANVDISDVPPPNYTDTTYTIFCIKLSAGDTTCRLRNGYNSTIFNNNGAYWYLITPQVLNCSAGKIVANQIVCNDLTSITGTFGKIANNIIAADANNYWNLETGAFQISNGLSGDSAAYLKFDGSALSMKLNQLLIDSVASKISGAFKVITSAGSLSNPTDAQTIFEVLPDTPKVTIRAPIYTSSTIYGGSGIWTGGKIANDDSHYGTLVSSGGIELYHATPYIDFHYANSTADFTSRIVESASGRLDVSGIFRAIGGIYVGQKTSWDDGVTGGLLSSNGSVSLTNAGNPLIYFFNANAKTVTNSLVSLSYGIQISSALYTNGKTSAVDGVSGIALMAGGIDISYSGSPFIDFHYANSTNDYTSRIIESASGLLSVSGKLQAIGGVFSGSKTANNDGITGGLLDKSGSLWLTSAAAAAIQFYNANATVTTNYLESLTVGIRINNSFFTHGKTSSGDGITGDVLGPGFIDIVGATPYIDFHYANSTSDYTSRIVESASGLLEITGKLKVDSDLQLGGVICAGNNWSSDATAIANGDRFATFLSTASPTTKFIDFGHDAANYNCGELSFTYAGAGSIANIITLGFFGGGIDGAIALKGKVCVGSSKYDTADGQTGVCINPNGGIEISHPATPYIDFHYANSTADYTSRIIECASGILEITGALCIDGGIYTETGATLDSTHLSWTHACTPGEHGLLFFKTNNTGDDRAIVYYYYCTSAGRATAVAVGGSFYPSITSYSQNGTSFTFTLTSLGHYYDITLLRLR